MGMISFNRLRKQQANVPVVPKVPQKKKVGGVTFNTPPQKPVQTPSTEKE